MTVPIVTTTHINSMKRTRPSLSAIAVCVRAPTASPAMYTATTCVVVSVRVQHTEVSLGEGSTIPRRSRRWMDGACILSNSDGRWLQDVSIRGISSSQSMLLSLLVVAMPVSKPLKREISSFRRHIIEGTNKQKCANGGENGDAQGVKVRHDIVLISIPSYGGQEGMDMICSR